MQLLNWPVVQSFCWHDHLRYLHGFPLYLWGGVSSAECADQLNAAVQLRVAFTAKSNKVPLAIIAAATAELLMMNFQIRHRAAALAAPAISPQHLLTQLLVFARVKPDARL